MTAPDERGDAELVAGLRGGDRRCLAEIYDCYADRIHDFCTGMLRDHDDAADTVQDTFVLANNRIGQLPDPGRLRPWLYKIARSMVMTRAQGHRRIRRTDTVIDAAGPAPRPERPAEQQALRRLVADASDGLSESDRAMLHLHLHLLEVPEIAEALGISVNTAHVRLTRLRDQVESALATRLAARLDRPDDDEWHRAAAGPWALLSGLVVPPAPPELRERVLGDPRLVAHSSPSWFGRSPRNRGAAVLLVAVLTGAAAMLWGMQSVTLAEAPTISLAPVPPGPAVPPGAPGFTPTATIDALPTTDPTNRIGPSGVTTSAPPLGPAVPPEPDPTPILNNPPSAPTPTTGPASTTPTSQDTTTPATPTSGTSTDPAPPPPRIIGQEATPSQVGVSGCRTEQAEVSVTLDAGTPATEAILSWQGPGGAGSMPMRGSGTAWSGSLGPFPEPARVQWSVTVSNAAGSTTSPTATLIVTSCTETTENPVAARGAR